eukprot:5476128-Pyramimonas_sp.AAC.1
MQLPAKHGHALGGIGLVMDGKAGALQCLGGLTPDPGHGLAVGADHEHVVDVQRVDGLLERAGNGHEVDRPQLGLQGVVQVQRPLVSLLNEKECPAPPHGNNG